jgi:hypothetical protein
VIELAPRAQLLRAQENVAVDNRHGVHVPADGVVICGSCDLGPRPLAVPGRFKVEARVEVRVKLGLGVASADASICSGLISPLNIW